MTDRLRISTKLLSVFALLLVLLGTMGGIGYYTFYLKQTSANDVIASQTLLADMQHYGQCSRSVLLQAALGLLLQNIEGTQERQIAIDSEIQAIEERITGRFTGEDAQLFEEVKETYRHFIRDNDRWFQIEKRRAEKKAELDAAGEKTIRAMENCIEAFQELMNISEESEESDAEKVYARFVEHIRKMDVGLGKITFLRYSYVELRNELNPEKKKEIARQMMNDIRALMNYLGEVKIIVADPARQRLIGEVVDAVHDWGIIMEAILEIMAEQNEILRKHNTNDVRIAELLDILMGSVRRHTEQVLAQSEETGTLMFQIEIMLAILTVMIGLILGYGTLKNYADNLERVVNERTAEVFRLQTAVLDTVADLVEFRDQLTGGHNERTQRYLLILIKELMRSNIYKEEVSQWNMDFLLPSAQLHDVGKIAIPDGILNKPGKLTHEEYAIMQNHVTVGIDALKKIKSNTSEHAFLRHAIAFAGAHHEKWDGTGYPMRLKGQNIPLEGRLMAIADVYDALISERPYKKALTHEEASRIIENESGKHFDPVLVDTFRRVRDEFVQVVEENKSVYLLGMRIPPSAG